MRTGRILGVEALLRYTSESGEVISPDAFITVAEETGLIVPIGDWVVNELEIEITESMAITNMERTLALLHEIRGLGVRISIDDFGTGFSGLAHLRSIPANTIKIDRAFVCNMMEIEDDAALVKAIIGIATTLRKHVIAEGVEQINVGCASHGRQKRAPLRRERIEWPGAIVLVVMGGWADRRSSVIV